MAEAVACRNCGAALQGAYCHECGQAAHETRTPIWTAVAIFVQQTFGADGRFWITLRKLLFAPGALTAEFLEGKQRRSLHPLRLFLICGVLALLTPDLRDAPRFEWPQAWEEPAAEGASFLDRFKLGEARLRSWVEDERVPFEQRIAFGAELNTSYLVYILVATVGLTVIVAKLMRPRRLLYDHIIFLLHLASFYYLSDALFRTLGWRTQSSTTVLDAVQAVYTALAFRRVYPWRTSQPAAGFVVDLACGAALFYVLNIISQVLQQIAAVYMMMPDAAKPAA